MYTGGNRMDMTMRKDVPEELTWDLSLIYASEKDMLRDTERMKTMAKTIEDSYKGKGFRRKTYAGF